MLVFEVGLHDLALASQPSLERGIVLKEAHGVSPASEMFELDLAFICAEAPAIAAHFVRMTMIGPNFQGEAGNR
jgi:hypothetical protein